MPPLRTIQRKCIETRSGCSRGRNREDEALWYGRAIVGLRDLWKTGRRRHHVLRDFVATVAANGQCSPHAVGRWRTQLERVLLTAQADTYSSRAAERVAAEPPLLLAELSVYSSVWWCLLCDSHVKVRLTETETETEKEKDKEKPKENEKEKEKDEEMNIGHTAVLFFLNSADFASPGSTWSFLVTASTWLHWAPLDPLGPTYPENARIRSSEKRVFNVASCEVHFL